MACARIAMKPLLALAMLGLAACASDPEPTPPKSASLRGRLVAEGDRLSGADLARAVVTLEAVPSQPTGAAPAPAVLRHRDAGLHPELLTVAPGDAVWLLNDDTLFHGAFSYSKPNDFDLGAYGPTEHRRLSFVHPGVVRIHCPFHPEESSVVFVASTRLVARPAANGRYEIHDVAPGRYWLRAWADGLPETRYDVTLRPGETAFRNIVLRSTSSGGDGAGPASPARP
jgi:plastocyanin